MVGTWEEQELHRRVAVEVDEIWEGHFNGCLGYMESEILGLAVVQ